MTLHLSANIPAKDTIARGFSALHAAVAALVGRALANRKFIQRRHRPADDQLDLESTVVVDILRPRKMMMEAIAHGRIRHVREMISANPDVNFTYNGDTPLHFAAEKGYSAIVQLLIDNGANLLARNCEGDTPLDIALAQKKFAKTTEILYKATIPLLAPGRA